MFEKTVTFIENPRYKQNNDENWMLIKYKNYNVIGHYCVDDKGNYYNGYEEVLNFELDNVKFMNNLEKLLKEKQADYGNFDETSYVMTKMMENFLSLHNHKEVKVPYKFFGLFMIMLKSWRIMQSKSYKKDSSDDIQGYNELLRRLLLNENATK